MIELKSNSLVTQTIALLTSYGFDLRGYHVSELVQQWLNHYQSPWIRLAVIEALYQGRYKAISVEQILNCWLRLGHPSYHFNHEFECLVCHKFPRYLISDSQNRVGKPFESECWEAVSNSLSNKQQATINPKVGETEDLDKIYESKVQWSNEPPKTVAEETEKPDSTSSPTQESEIPPSQGSISRFTPSSDDSEFYSKLKAMTNLDLELAVNFI